MVPVFDRLTNIPEMLPRLLQLPTHGHPLATITPPTPRLLDTQWGKSEKSLPPPTSLLTWLIHNLPSTKASKPTGTDSTAQNRLKLFEKDPDTIRAALDLLNTNKKTGWHILEGHSQPDAYLATEDTIIIVEGKRTESGPTIGTTWMPKRHQMLRHLDAAWEHRGSRRVYGMIIVEGAGGADAVDVPPKWVEASLNTTSKAAIEDSLPHRSPAEQQEIARCFLGVTTWQAVCQAFNINWTDLPDRI